MEEFNVFPHGLSLGQGTFRPAMIFKDKKETEVLPVWLESTEVNVLLSSTQISGRDGSPLNATLKLMNSFGIRIESVNINEISNSVQYAEVTAKQENKVVKFRVRAGEALSLALSAGCSFSTNRDIAEKSRTLNFQVMVSGNPLGEGPDKKDLGALH